jgi:molybdenum cofactor cytidylyltransferase
MTAEHFAPRRIAAIVPAAGLGSRLGGPKLTLPLGGSTVLERVVRGLVEGGANPVLVVAPPADRPWRDDLIARAERSGGTIVRLDRSTPDMKATVAFGIRAIPTISETSGVLIAPGDSVGVAPGLVRAMIERFEHNHNNIIIPTYKQKRGHPLLLPVSIAVLIPALAEDRGIDSLVRRFEDRVIELAWNDAAAVADIDTREDYEFWRDRAKESLD